jgi:hypothetical protein
MAAEPRCVETGAQCPEDPEETAEMLYLRRLAPAAELQFTNHVATCVECRKIYERTVTFIQVLRAAAKVLEQAHPSEC